MHYNSDTKAIVYISIKLQTNIKITLLVCTALQTWNSGCGDIGYYVSEYTLN